MSRPIVTVIIIGLTGAVIGYGITHVATAGITVGADFVYGMLVGGGIVFVATVVGFLMARRMMR